VRRNELTELHYIAPIANLVSVLQRGILSHARAQGVAHTSVAMQAIQHRRSTVIVPGGRPLHEYANLYICARNPMLFLRKGQHEELCVLRVSPDVLDLEGVVVVSGNASSVYVRFGAGAEGLEVVDRDLTFAEYWTDPDEIERWRKKSAKCAEVLIPDILDPRHVIGAYVSGDVGITAFRATGVALPVAINRHLFFL
jgi:ssDNA thymidine ADP-ribosyltransferase DarT-like protein